jgi:hypothetical protein
MKRIALITALILLTTLACTAAYRLPPDLAQIVDPNKIIGTLLPPVSGDPNTWSLPVGKHTRTGAAQHVSYLDFDFDHCMPRLSESLFLHETTWEFEMWVVPGINYKVVRAFADPRYLFQSVQYYTIVVNGLLPAGEKPTLD